MALNNQRGHTFRTEDADKLLAASINAEISRKSPAQCFIYKVPAKFRTKSDKDTYEPRIISIGPYHNGGDTFRMTEEHKRWYLQDLVSRKKESRIGVIDFVKSIRSIEGLARECYAESIKDISSNEFVKMMVFDGGFILELLYKFSEKSERDGEDRNSNDNMSRDGELEMRTNYVNDPVLGATWMVYSLRKDLVLLENQLPFIVLEKLFELTKSSSPGNCSLNELITAFFSPILPNVRAVPTSSTLRGNHILDLLRSHLLPSAHLMEVGDYPYWEYTQSATDLANAGVKFKKKDPADGLLDITFTDDGTLQIPPFFFGESWTALLPNLIAFEQCRRDYTDQITSYVILMDSLINSGHDVKILRKNGIIDGLFHEDDKVAVEINNLFKGAVVDRFYYDGLCNRVNAYCKKPWHKWRAIAMRDYFNTPWSIIKFVAAVILLVLAATQTAYSIKSYSPDKK